MKRAVIVVLGLLVFGALKLPFERELTQEHRAAFFHGAKLDLTLREQIGQGAFIAALSGFRSLVADLLWISADTAWQRLEWSRMILIYNNVTTLQPRVVMFWDMASWQMAWNAAKFAREDPKQPREALRIRAEKEYIQLGRNYAENGARNNPDRYEIYIRLANLLRDRSHDHVAASEAFAKAADFKNALGFERRFSGYELSEVPGRERDAYTILLACYNRGPQEWAPTLFKKLKTLEEKLNIPKEQRVYIPPQKDS